MNTSAGDAREELGVYLGELSEDSQVLVEVKLAIARGGTSSVTNADTKGVSVWCWERGSHCGNTYRMRDGQYHMQ